MSNYLSRAELEEISEGLIRVYAAQHKNKVIQSIDIEHFITDFLKLRIEYTAFAENDSGKADENMELIAKLLANPETASLLKALAKSL